MKILPPIPISDSILLSSDIAEPSPGEVAWTPSTTYSAGDVRIRSTTHRVYVAARAIANTVVTPPETDPANWIDSGPTNRFAMFDVEKNTASAKVCPPTGLTVVLKPGRRVSSLAMFGLSADSVSITVTDGISGPVVYQKSLNLSTRYTNSWYTYFFGEFTFRQSVVFNDIPLISTAVISLTFFKSSGSFSCETLAIGNAICVGGARYGIQSDILDFSRVDRDSFGSATLVKRKNVPTMSVQVMVNNSLIPKMQRLRSDFAASPLVFMGIEDSGSDLFDAYALIGIFKRMPIVAEVLDMSVISIEIEGL